MKKGSHHKSSANEKNRRSHIGKTASEETCALLSSMRTGDNNVMKRPEVAAKISDRMKKNNPMSDPAVRARMAATKRAKKIKLSQEHKDKIAAGTKEALADPDVRRRMSESHEGVERPQWVRDKISDGKKGRSFSQEHCKNIKTARNRPETLELIRVINLGSNNPMWKDGTSFEPYCEKFTAHFKERVRVFFRRECALCHKPESSNSKRRDHPIKLSVHHIYTEKSACCESKIEEMEQLRKRFPLGVARFGEPEFSEEEIMYIRMMVPLCCVCHGKMNGEEDNTPYEETTFRKYFTELIINKYQGKCYFSEEEMKAEKST